MAAKKPHSRREFPIARSQSNESIKEAEKEDQGQDEEREGPDRLPRSRNLSRIGVRRISQFWAADDS